MQRFTGALAAVLARRGRSAFPVALSALALALAACGRTETATVSPSPSVQPPASSTAVASPVPVRPAPTPRPPPEGLKRGGFLRFAVPEAPPNLDPHQTVSLALHTWGPGLAYSRLFRFATGPGVESPNGDVLCDLCESWEQPDLTTVRVKLRANARWQDIPPLNGRPVNASDVVYSLRRLATPGWVNAPLMSNVESVTAPDDSTVEIKLRGPDAETLERLADTHAKVVAYEVAGQSGGLLRGPTVGSGPWQLSSFDLDAASYRPNLRYYVPGVPYLDGLEVQVIPDAQTRITAVRNRLLDLDQAAFRDVQEATTAFPDLRVTRVLEPGAGVSVALNASRPPFEWTDARRAVFMAWDPWAVIKSIWDGEGLVSAGLPVPAPSWLLPEDELRPLFADPAGARALLAGLAALGRRPQKVTLTAGEYGGRYIATAEALAGQLAAVGVQADVERVTTRVFGERVWLGGDYQVFVGAQPPVSSLNAYLFSVVHSRGQANTTRVQSSALDSLIEEQSAELDPEARRQKALTLQRGIMAGAHRFNVVTRVSHWVYQPYVRDFAPNLYRGENYWLAEVWLATVLKN